MTNLRRTPEAVAAAKLVLDIGAAIKTVRPDLIRGTENHERAIETLESLLLDAAGNLLTGIFPDCPEQDGLEAAMRLVDTDGDPLSLIEFGVALGRALDREPA